MYDNLGLWTTCSVVISTSTPFPTLVALTPQPTLTGNNWICTSNTYNCGDFSSWSEANSAYQYCIAQGHGDIHKLDSDDDGDPCESL